MARESIFIEEIRQPSPPTTEVVQSTHADVAVDIFIQALRECFKNHPLYTYVPREDSQGPDFQLTKIVIVDKYTEDALLLPCLTMSFNSASTKWIQFSQTPFNTVLKPQMNRDGSIKRDERGRMIPSHYEYTGAYDGQVSFLISAQDTIEREELCNLLHVLLVENLRDRLYRDGIFIKTVSTGGQSEVPYRNDNIYQATVSADFYSEWRRKIPVGDTLKSIGFNMNIDDGYRNVVKIDKTLNAIPVNDLKNSYYVKDDVSGESFVPVLLLSATSSAAPITLVYNALTVRWEVSAFWKKVLLTTLIPYENLRMEINKESQTKKYLDHSAKAIIQATKLRALALSQGRRLYANVKVIQHSFVYEDGTVELKGGIEPNNPLIYSTVVNPDNSVVMKFFERNKNRHILVAKAVVVDSEGNASSGSMYKRQLINGVETDTQLSTVDQDFLDGENLNTMTTIDLFMIMQFGEQPFRYTLQSILNEIDKLLNELGNMSITISNRLQKITSTTMIKQGLIARSEQFLLQQPVGL